MKISKSKSQRDLREGKKLTDTISLKFNEIIIHSENSTSVELRINLTIFLLLLFKQNVSRKIVLCIDI